jgi:hypothetical protein
MMDGRLTMTDINSKSNYRKDEPQADHRSSNNEEYVQQRLTI